MRLFLYYAVHSVKNQIKKLFKTWVAVFMLVCVLFGVMVGLGAAMLSDAVEDEAPPAEEEILTEEEIPLTEDDILPLAEVAVAGITLAILLWNVVSADKSGGQIFPMADVNLLFPSPLKPQSVLLFRLMSQLGTILLASLYLVFQLPNMMLNLGLNVPTCIAVLLLWFLLLTYAKLINILIYTLTSTFTKCKRYIRPAAYGAVGLFLLCFFGRWQAAGTPSLDTIFTFFNAPWTRLIPVYGWMKGLLVFTAEGQWWPAAGCLAALLVGTVALTWGIWHIKADFYEDAMQHSTETAALQQAAETAGTVAVKRKKERSDRLRRDDLTRGEGAAVYFHKTMYNRFRFAHGRVFTKTSETYLVTVLAVCAIMQWAFHAASIIPSALTLGVFVFFRSLGNPLAVDVGTDSFRMVPESAHAKVFFSLLGGSLNCVLDLLPAFFVAAVWMRANPLTALLWLLLVATVDFYSANVGLFLDVSIPTKAGKMIKQLMQVMFVYFGLLPVAVLVVLGFVLKLLPLFLVFTALFNLGIGFLFFGISPLFIQHGQK